MRQTTFKKKKGNKNILIPFSGGVDSTYLAFKNLEEGNDIALTRFNIENNTNQTNIECLAMKDIIPLLQDHFPKRSITMRSYERKNMSNQSFEVLGGHMVNGPQPPLWVFCLIFDENLWDIDEVHMGYVNGDEAIPYIDDIKKLYKSFSPFMERDLPPLKFPLKKEYKWELWKYLPDHIKKNTSFCEYSYYRHKPCGNCKPCLTMMFCDLWEEWHELNETTPKVRVVRERTEVEGDMPEENVEADVSSS